MFGCEIWNVTFDCKNNGLLLESGGFRVVSVLYLQNVFFHDNDKLKIDSYICHYSAYSKYNLFKYM